MFANQVHHGWKAAWAAVIIVIAFLGGLVAPRAFAANAAFEGIPAARLQQVIDHCYNLERNAPQQIAALQHDFPDALAPEFVRVIREYWLQQYAEVDRGQTEAFERDAAALIERAQRTALRRPTDTDAACIAGMSQLIVGLYSVEKRRWWTAFWKIRAGRNAMVDILEQHPDYADAKLGAGLADCYLDRTPRYLKPLTVLLGAHGDFDRGFQRLREARDRGLLTSVEAQFYLSGIQTELRHDGAAARDAMAALAQRFPANPMFQRLLGYFEMTTGQRVQGRQRLARIPDMAAIQSYPALGVRSQMWLCWDCMRTKEYSDALGAAERADVQIHAHAELLPLRGEVLIGQGEALKALHRYEEAFARFEAVSSDNPELRRHALDRVRSIKREINWRS